MTDLIDLGEYCILKARRMSQNYSYLRSKLTLFIVIPAAEVDKVCTACTPLSPTECGVLEASYTKHFMQFQDIALLL